MAGRKGHHVTENTSSGGSSVRADEAAARRLAAALSPSTIDSLIKDVQAAGTPLDGADGLLNQMTEAVLDRVLQAEMTGHLGFESGDPAGQSIRRRWQLSAASSGN